MSFRDRRHGGNNQNQLIIYHNPLGSVTFDPRVTTSLSATVIWQTEAGTTVTTGTTHDLSYTPTAGAKVCKVTVVGGLRSILTINLAGDAVTRISNVPNLINCYTFAIHANPDIVFDLNGIRSSILSEINCNGNYGTTGNTKSVGNITYLFRCENSPIVGALSDFTSTALQNLIVFGCPGITAASIAALLGMRDIRIYNMSWLESGMNTVIDSIYQNRDKFTYASPAMQILTGNAAPTGTYAAPPADESDNSDWAYDAGVGHHWPLTSNAKRWYVTHGPDRGTADTFNRWAIS